MESHHPTTAEVKNLLGFSEIVVLLPFFGGDEVFLVITHLEFKPNTVPFRWAYVHLFIAFPRQAL